MEIIYIKYELSYTVRDIHQISDVRNMALNNITYISVRIQYWRRIIAPRHWKMVHWV